MLTVSLMSVISVCNVLMALINVFSVMSYRTVEAHGVYVYLDDTRADLAYFELLDVPL